MYNESVFVNLNEYGIEGVAEIAMPTFSRKKQMKNELGRCQRTQIGPNGEPMFKEMDIGDMEVIKVLVFVKSAPFPTDIKGFTEYCDKMDEKDLGSADEMFEALKDAIDKLGDMPGPLGN